MGGVLVRQVSPQAPPAPCAQFKCPRRLTAPPPACGCRAWCSRRFGSRWVRWCATWCSRRAAPPAAAVPPLRPSARIATMPCPAHGQPRRPPSARTWCLRRWEMAGRQTSEPWVGLVRWREPRGHTLPGCRRTWLPDSAFRLLPLACYPALQMGVWQASQLGPGRRLLWQRREVGLPAGMSRRLGIARGCKLHRDSLHGRQLGPKWRATI